MSDLDLLGRRMEALGAIALTTQDEQRLATITVCEGMIRNGSTVEQTRDVLSALGLYAP
jgi:hypothetical protein